MDQHPPPEPPCCVPHAHLIHLVELTQLGLKAKATLVLGEVAGLAT